MWTKLLRSLPCGRQESLLLLPKWRSARETEERTREIIEGAKLDFIIPLQEVNSQKDCGKYSSLSKYSSPLLFCTGRRSGSRIWSRFQDKEICYCRGECKL
ncbi:uncharacterized protein LOC131054770 isoform X2 [Cryptomeria japonica]|uniref:uncharacterized protein LOC131054770 isoform X2 n=1 Tax=Cryptomeria japonica TaxID=3369 RepID=UPI0027DA3708|nr:uncharacterized protein LOC131054770 isoform X2 [Cryptomeria japonica]